MKKYPKLPPKFKKKWIAALRSGKYKQGDSILKGEFSVPGDAGIETRYCCLGVACSVAKVRVLGEAPFIEEEEVSNIKKIPAALRGDDKNELVRILSIRNDSGRWKFDRIANWIEKYL